MNVDKHAWKDFYLGMNARYLGDLIEKKLQCMDLIGKCLVKMTAQIFSQKVLLQYSLVLCYLNMRAYKSQINLSKRGIKSSTYTLHIATWCQVVKKYKNRYFNKNYLKKYLAQQSQNIFLSSQSSRPGNELQAQVVASPCLHLHNKGDFFYPITPQKLTSRRNFATLIRVAFSANFPPPVRLNKNTKPWPARVSRHKDLKPPSFETHHLPKSTSLT